MARVARVALCYARTSSRASFAFHSLRQTNEPTITIAATTLREPLSARSLPFTAGLGGSVESVHSTGPVWILR